MKNIVLALVVCLVSNQGPATKLRPDREHDGFVGPVKKVFVTWTPVSGSTYPAGSKCRQLTNEYDQLGRITRHSVYPGDCGSDEIREDHTYSPDGARDTKLTEIRGANSPRPPPPMAQSNAERRKAPGVKVLIHDYFGRLIEEGSIKGDGRYSYRTSYTYDPKGRLLETRDYDNESLTSQRVYSYSGDERVPSGFVYYGSDGIIFERTTYSDYEFNSKGDWIKRTQNKDERFNPRSVSITYREIDYYPVNK